MASIKYLITFALILLVIFGTFAAYALETGDDGIPVQPILSTPEPQVEVYREVFTETTGKLDNPARGLYSMVGFYIKDQQEDYEAKIDTALQSGSPINLLMLHINLAYYSDRDLTPEALNNISELFSMVRTKGLRLIVRLVYDWDGKSVAYEPQSLDIITNHMRQLKDILYANQDQIFVLQGLFTGKWGEMNGTRHGEPEALRHLAHTLLDVTGENTFLSVRTGSQWRTITEVHEPNVLLTGLFPRIGLYNDGMLGSETDCGSYYPNGDQDAEPTAAWSRGKELAFQELLCRRVPNGGEVIINNPINDFENAVAALKTMHVSYLNYDYDKEVLNKWAAVTVDSGIYSGMDGLTYIERHLGYRILIDDARIAYHKPNDTLILDLDLKNVGFAPLYSEKNIILRVYNKNNQLVLSHEFDQDIRQLHGGNDYGDLLELHHEIPLEGWANGDYSVYLTVNDTETGEPLILANEQSIAQYGYKIAGIKRS